MPIMYKKIDEAVAFLQSNLPSIPKILVILGSGLGPLADLVEHPVTINYKDIPHLPHSNVTGHKGTLIHGAIAGKEVLMMNGRFHYYEGFNSEELAFPLRVFATLGVKTLIVTNACGGIKEGFVPGTLVVIEDHISLFCPPVLRGPNYDRYGQRFLDMSTAYTPRLRELAFKVAEATKVTLQKGVYVFYPGPTYESPADIRALRSVGADIVGMSTVPEVVVAHHAGMEVLAIGLVTNRAAGLSKASLNHEEVLETAKKSEKQFTVLIKSIIEKI